MNGQDSDGIGVRRNPDGWAEVDDNPALWWSDSGRPAFRHQQHGEQP